MKNIIFTAILLSFTLLIFAQEPISMRSQATGNTIEDNWDLIYDTIELKFVDGIHFYTNLADFNTIYKNEEWADDNVPFLSELPLGIAFTNPFATNLKHSFLLRLRNSMQPESVNGGEGEHSEKNTNYEDKNDDGIYDYISVYDISNNNYDISKKSSFVLNNSFGCELYTYGLKFTINSENEEDDEAINDMGIIGFGHNLHPILKGNYGESIQETLFSIEDDLQVMSSDVNSDFSTITENDNSKIDFSFMTLVNIFNLRPEFRFDLSLNNVSKKDVATDDKYYGEFNYIETPDLTGLQDQEHGFINDSYISKTETDGKNFIGKFAIKNILQNTKKRRDCGFWEIGMNFGLGSGNYHYESSRKTNSLEVKIPGESNLFSSIDSTYYSLKIVDHGDWNGTQFQMFGKYKYNLSKDVIFGISSIFDYSSINRETDYSYSMYQKQSLLYGAGYDDEDSYVALQTESNTADREYFTQIWENKIPVGLEFKLPEKDLSINDSFSLRNFSFRLGTTYTYTKIIEEDKHQIKTSKPNTNVYTFGNGEIDIFIDENSFSSTKNRSENISASKRFSGGIGYQHSENLSIDAGGYVEEDGENYYLGISFSLSK